jgi:hypothetical protein
MIEAFISDAWIACNSQDGQRQVEGRKNPLPVLLLAE